MTTVRDLITRAYRKIGVVAADTPLSADQAQAGLDAFNAMMFGLPMLGVYLYHARQTIDEALLVQEQFEEGLVYLLARRIAPDSEVAWPDENDWMRAMQMATITINPIRADGALRTTPSQLPFQRVTSS